MVFGASWMRHYHRKGIPFASHVKDSFRNHPLWRQWKTNSIHDRGSNRHCVRHCWRNLTSVVLSGAGEILHIRNVHYERSQSREDGTIWHRSASKLHGHLHDQRCYLPVTRDERIMGSGVRRIEPPSGQNHYRYFRRYACHRTPGSDEEDEGWRWGIAQAVRSRVGCVGIQSPVYDDSRCILITSSTSQCIASCCCLCYESYFLQCMIFTFSFSLWGVQRLLIVKAKERAEPRCLNRSKNFCTRVKCK